MPTAAALPPELSAVVDSLRGDLAAIFGTRLRSLVAYGARLFPATIAARKAAPLPLNTLALVDQLSFDDLQACSARVAGWRRAGLAMPLLLSQDEFQRSLDVFPFEYGDIVARHVVVNGPDPFAGMTPRPEDVRRACEAQAKGHLIHLREGFLEAGGKPAPLASLVAASSVPFAALVAHVARLRNRDDSSMDALVQGVEDVPGVRRAAVREVLGLVSAPVMSNDDGRRLFPDYLASVEAIVSYLDTWNQA